MSERTILITGAGGLLAPYLVDAASSYGAVVTSARNGGTAPCDLADRVSLQQMLDRVSPSWVVHAAGMTDVDACERSPESADLANRQIVANLVDFLPIGVRLVVVSTDQVYPDLPGPHRELTTGPINAYGRSKLAGEMVALTYPAALVLRTNLFGPSRTDGRRSLDDFVVDSLRDRCAITLFTDIYFSPLHMATLADTLFEALLAGLTGVYNLGSRAGLTKAEFGLAVARHSGLSIASVTLGVSTAAVGRAPRPHDLRMDVSRLEVALDRPMPSLLEEIAKL